jgi:hypothetical protein
VRLVRPARSAVDWTAIPCSAPSILMPVILVFHKSILECRRPGQQSLGLGCACLDGLKPAPTSGRRPVGPLAIPKYQRPLSTTSNCPASTEAMADTNGSGEEVGCSCTAMQWRPASPWYSQFGVTLVTCPVSSSDRRTHFARLIGGGERAQARQDHGAPAVGAQAALHGQAPAFRRERDVSEMKGHA